MSKVKDELGIEMDEDLVELLKDPKSGLLLKAMDYRDSRKVKELEIKAKEEADKPKPATKLFGIF